MTDIYSTLSGTGDVTLLAARFVPLIGVSVTTLPPGAAVMDSTAPKRLMKIGWIAPGRAGSDPSWPSSLFFGDAQWIDFERELFTYPTPGVFCDRIRYHLEPGAVATLYVNDTGVPDVPNAFKMPWDRTPVAWNQSSFVVLAGGTSVTTAWTYTVPSGKLLMLSHYEVRLSRSIVATTLSSASVVGYVNATEQLRAISTSNVVGGHQYDQIGGGPLYLPAGSTVTTQYFSNDTGGQHYAFAYASGLLFNV